MAARSPSSAVAAPSAKPATMPQRQQRRRAAPGARRSGRRSGRDAACSCACMSRSTGAIVAAAQHRELARRRSAWRHIRRHGRRGSSAPHAPRATGRRAGGFASSVMRSLLSRHRRGRAAGEAKRIEQVHRRHGDRQAGDEVGRRRRRAWPAAPAICIRCSSTLPPATRAAPGSPAAAWASSAARRRHARPPAPEASIDSTTRQQQRPRAPRGSSAAASGQRRSPPNRASAATGRARRGQGPRSPRWPGRRPSAAAASAATSNVRKHVQRHGADAPWFSCRASRCRLARRPRPSGSRHQQGGDAPC